MKGMGLEALYRKPRTTRRHPSHQVYPYLLRELTITWAIQVWAMDITYIPLAKGFVYLVAVVDWYTRRVLAWRVPITLDVQFCLEAVEIALSRYGKPNILNTDQGSLFTSHIFTELLKRHGIRLSMDGRGAWRDNIFIFVERLWRSVKYEEFISMPMSRSQRHEPDSRAISSFITVAARTPASPSGCQIRCIFSYSRSPERPNSTRSDPLIDSHQVVQKTGATCISDSSGSFDSAAACGIRRPIYNNAVTESFTLHSKSWACSTRTERDAVQCSIEHLCIHRNVLPSTEKAFNNWP